MSDELEKRVAELALKVGIYEERERSIDRRLSNIEDTLKWLVRLVVGGLIGAIVAFIVKGGLVVG
jgi:hypothetical protein